MKVKDLMSSRVKCSAAFETLKTAAQTMWDNDIGCVPVVDNGGRAIGMLTDRDVCMAAYLQNLPLSAALVTSAMSRELFTCAPDDEIAAAERLMREKQVHRLPVVDTQGRPIGILSLNDIAREGEREAEAKKAREVTDAEIARVMAAVCAPRHRVIEAAA